MLLLAVVAPSAAFVAPSQPRTHTALAAQTSRTEFLRDVAAVGIAAATTAGAALPAFADEVTASGVSIKVSKEGKGPKPEIGELAAIRFAAFAGENKIDDIFDTPEPYYTRVGSGGLIKGVEEVLPKMRVGDRWVLTVPVSEMPSLSYILCTQYILMFSGMACSPYSSLQIIQCIRTNHQGNLAFGPNGRKASAGKPRIPGNAEIIFDVEMVGLPGKEQELIELIGDE